MTAENTAYLAQCKKKALAEYPLLQRYSSGSCSVLPGLCDVHVHLREPGFSYKETIRTGTMSAAAGGFTTVCAMPNLKPVPDSPEHLREELDLIERDAVIRVLPYGAITVGEAGERLADLEGMAPFVAGFSDDGRGVQDPGLMREAMARAKALGKMIVAHCEDNALLWGGYIHDGAYAKAHGHRGICSESEYGQIARDLKLAEETGCAYHVCHISCRESVALIRDAKRSGVDVTCETAPHYILLDDGCLQEEGRFKMNPPLRSPFDREAILEGVLDGTVDILATDHAAHSAEEKRRGLAGSAFGIVGLETAFPLLYSRLVKPGILSLERLMELMNGNPRRRFGIAPDGGYSVWNLEETYPVDPEGFYSKGRATPFAGTEVSGRCLATYVNGKAVFERNL